jgi:Icc-related predicted phosphoesterase
MRKVLFILLFATAAITALGQTGPLEIKSGVGRSFRFVAYGDTRFTDTANTKDANPEVRQELVRAIAGEHPAFISFGGDIPMEGSKIEDWKIYDLETAIWKQQRITVYPVLGNHELKTDPKIGLQNYFSRFPSLKENRYYSVRTANTLLLCLDSLVDETTGAQGDWLRDQLKNIPQSVDFVFIVLHYPPVSSSGDKSNGRSGGGTRPAEQKLALFLEEQQASMRARIVAFSGHVHNYERHQHGGVTYFVTGGGGAHAYPIARAADDPFQSSEINYHYILVEVNRGKLVATMKRLEIIGGVKKWSAPDSVTIVSPKTAVKP